ncbi:hypothetical protein [Actinoallomurus sp. NPDC052274]|uniref:hypothetical protein n=1 Tax=Actinoallomurus sp. NPDC052274 TaxID=3155420 RepID=UPI003419C26E
MAKMTVRVSMFAEPIEVDSSEIPGLRQQGLLVDEREALIARRDTLAAELASVEAELKVLEPADPEPAPDPAKAGGKQSAKAARGA